MKTVVVLITCDTKAEEAEYLRRRIGQMGARALVADTGVRGKPKDIIPDISNMELAELGEVDFAGIASAGTRGAAVGKMAEALKTALPKLHAQGRLDGVICVGGAGSFIGAPAMQLLPLGVPKVIVSPLASGTRPFAPYVGSSDIMVMHSVIDIAGMNNISRKIYDNAAAAVAGMALGQEKFDCVKDERRCIGITMMGTTTPGASAAQHVLEEAGYRCVIFHASGVGGASMERLAKEGAFAGVLDYTLAEMVGTHVGGFTKTDPERLSVVGKCGLPQVVAPGCVDFMNLFPHEVDAHRHRAIYNHNPQYPLGRTTKEEMLVVAGKIAEQLNKGYGPTTVVMPLHGFSDPNCPGGAFWDPASDEAFRQELKHGLKEEIKVMEVDAWINDPLFGQTAANELLKLLNQSE